MKKLLFSIVLVLVLSSCAWSSGHRVGVLEKLGVTAENFKRYAVASNDIFVSSHKEKPEFSFYKSMSDMLMALEAGKVDEILLPQPSAEYILALHPEYSIECTIILRHAKALLAFGFKAGNEELRNAFNDALKGMKKDGTLWLLKGKYIDSRNTAMCNEDNLMATPSIDPADPVPVVFKKFEGAREITVAVTGDLPPLDYIAPDGKPEGFNAAILAEICGRLGLNVKLVNIDSGARAAMLSSGRADVVFWFEYRRGNNGSYDIPEGVIISEPYYEIDMFFHLSK